MYCVFVMDDAYYTYVCLPTYFEKVVCEKTIKIQMLHKLAQWNIFVEIKMLRVDVEAKNKYKYLKI